VAAERGTDARVWSIISAPTNLGLRPPAPGATPGTAKAAEALREVGLYDRLMARGAEDAGVVLSGRYLDDADPANARLRNHDAILAHAERLADRIQVEVERGRLPLLLGGDCSVLVGVGLAMRRRGNVGLVHIDGHTDYRNPGNSSECASLAGEDLAAVTGKHWDTIADHRGQGPYFDPGNTVHLGCRDNDEELDEATRDLRRVVPASRVMRDGIAAVVVELTTALTHTDGWWLHVDIDVLDPDVMPAVDSPDPGGLTVRDLGDVLGALVPGCIGIDFTVYDPDLDPDLTYARVLSGVIERAVLDPARS
jgi:arginase